MNAIVLTESQTASFRAARTPNALRVLEPRRIQDGRLILNADILDDPFFTQPEKPWAAILAGEPAIIADPDSVLSPQPSALEIAAIATGLAQAKSRIVTLTAANLVGPAQ